MNRETFRSKLNSGVLNLIIHKVLLNEVFRMNHRLKKHENSNINFLSSQPALCAHIGPGDVMNESQINP